MIDLRAAKKRQRKRVLKGISDVFKLTILFLAFLIVIENYVLGVMKVDGRSMEDTIHDGQFVLIFKTHSVKRGDIIDFQHGNITLIKRVIGLPGDTVDISQDGTVWINGEPLEEDYIETLYSGDITTRLPVTLKNEEYFCMGDNRVESVDSRSAEIGIIKKNDIIGKVILY